MSNELLSKAVKLEFDGVHDHKMATIQESFKYFKLAYEEMGDCESYNETFVSYVELCMRMDLDEDIRPLFEEIREFLSYLEKKQTTYAPTFFCWGTLLRKLAEEDKDVILYEESIKRWKQFKERMPDFHEVIKYDWLNKSIAENYLEIARINHDEASYLKAASWYHLDYDEDKYAYQSLESESDVRFELYQMKRDKETEQAFLDAAKFALKNRETCYSLALYYAEKKDLTLSLKYLEANISRNYYLKSEQLDQKLWSFAAEDPRFQWIMFRYQEGYMTQLVDTYRDEAKKLIVLDLSRERLSELPEKVAAYPNMTHLILDFSRDMGKLPDKVLAHEKLESISLRENTYLEVLRDLDKVKNLKELILCGMKFTPKSVGAFYLDIIASCKNLTRLTLDKGSLSNLPNQFEQLTKLEYLSLEKNGFKQVPEVLKKLKGLQILNLKKNKKLEFIQEEIVMLPNLKELQVGDWMPLEELREKQNEIFKKKRELCSEFKTDYQF